MKIDDRRTENTIGFVLGTDSFMSGWGLAPGRSLFAVPVIDPAEYDVILANMEARSDMKRARVVTGITKTDKLPRVRLREGDHLSVRSVEDTARFREPNSW